MGQPQTAVLRSSYLLWQLPKQNVSVLFNLDLIDVLKSFVSDGLELGQEVGGILLGRVERQTAGHLLITIDNCETLKCEHRFGRSFVLSERDKHRLERRLKPW